MKYNPEIHHRKSIRLKDYDYSSEGLYFITICAYQMEHLFGKIIDGKMILNSAVQMIERIYKELNDNFENAQLEEYVIMPNHFHCIIEIIDKVGAESISALKKDLESPKLGLSKNRVDMESTPTTIPKIIQSFKRYTTLEYIKMVKNNQLPNFDKRVWQRNYYDNIIRNEKVYLKVLEYIENNPARWDEDRYR